MIEKIEMKLRRSVWRLMLMTILFVLLTVHTVPKTYAQESTFFEDSCFAVADGFINTSGVLIVDEIAQDTLLRINRITGETASVNGLIPNITENGSGVPVTNIEAIAFQPGGQTLFVANGGQLGTIQNLSTPVFLPRPSPFGTGQGYVNGSTTLSSNTFEDVDSLTFDVLTGRLWGIEREKSKFDNFADLLFEIDPITGSFVPDAFPDPNIAGQRVDFVEVKPIDPGGSGFPLTDIDDIASDPVTGQLYGIMNLGGGPSKLVTINPLNGSTVEVGDFARQDTGELIEDMEGLAFDNSGQLYGSTGKDWTDGRNVLWRINKDTAVVETVGQFVQGASDIESLACLTAFASLQLEKSTNNMDADEAPGLVIPQGETVTWRYFVRNTGSQTLTTVRIIDDNGTPFNTSDDQIICQGFDLAPGQSNLDVGANCQLSGTTRTGQYTNIATVTAQATGPQGTVLDFETQDSSNYFGYIPTAVGDFVWLDLNRNGLRDEFEPPVSGAQVTLFREDGSTVLSTSTSKTGFYLFPNLTPGRYFIRFDLSGTPYTTFTVQNVGDDPELDSNVDSSGQTPVFELVSGQTDLTQDAGVLGDGLRASIGDFVWQDLNGDGRQDANEPGLAGVTVTLRDINDNPVGSPITTGSDGFYRFENLQPGDYSLQFSLPAGFSYSPINQGLDDANDSDVSPDTGQTALINLLPGESDQTIDAGYLRQALGDFVWLDLNRNGLQDAGEPGVEDVTVELRNSAGTVIQTTTTDANGRYIFANLDTGTYTVRFTAPANLSFTTQNASSGQPSAISDQQDSDADVSSGISDSVTIGAGEVNLTVDAGLVTNIASATIGDRVFEDTNRNGIQESGEPSVAGIVVNLWTDDDEDGDPDSQLSTTTTDGNGNYSFTNLDPNKVYIIQFILPNGRQFTTPNATSDQTDSDADPSDGTSDPITLTPGENDDTVDAGLLPTTTGVTVTPVTVTPVTPTGTPVTPTPAILTLTPTPITPSPTPVTPTPTTPASPDTDGDDIPDNIDIDDDNDGILDINEGDGNRDTDRDGIPDSRDIDSDDDGNPDLVESQGGDPGDVTVPSGQDSDGDGLDDVFDAVDNNPDPTASQGTDPIDTDNDGLEDHRDIDSDDDGITDLVEATDKDGDGQPDITPTNFDTDRDGLDNAFDTNPQRPTTTNPADSSVSAPDSDDDGLPNQVDIDSDEDGIPDNVESQPTIGYDPPIGNDSDDDGLDDAYDSSSSPDPAVSQGITPENTDNTDQVDYLDTDSDNDDIPDIQENGEDNTPSGQDSDNDGLDDAFDDVVGDDPNDDENNPATDLPDEDDDANSGGDVDYRDNIPQTASLGDRVFEDTDEDGTQDGDEPGVPGVPVNLLIDTNNDGIPDTVEESDITDGNGRYDFTGLDPDETYFVQFLAPTGREFTAQNIGQDGLDSDANPANGVTGPIDLDPNENDPTIDAGLLPERDDPTPTPVTPTPTPTNTPIDILTQEPPTPATTAPTSTPITPTPTPVTPPVTPVTPTPTLPTGPDTDGDGIVDSIDIDDDNDGLLDVVEGNGTRDTDGDGIPDSRDIDSDNDGNPDIVESQGGDPANFLAPKGGDPDGDGLDSVFDAAPDNPSPIASQGTVPIDSDDDGVDDHQDIDSDDDGITDLVEATDKNGDGQPDRLPANDDSDNDGLDDAFDTNPGADPVANPGGSNVSAPDSDGDGLPNQVDIDSDEDGIPDNVESQPTIGYDPPTGNDSDDDGLDDAYDENNSTPDPVASQGTTPENTDNSDLVDYLDTDSDNDGLDDVEENGEADTPSTQDGDEDGLDDAFDDVIGDDPNDDEDNPATDLPDEDGDVNSGGDVDYRDQGNTAALGDRVFEDLNENGAQDTDEPGVPGVRVNLFTDDNGDGEPDRPVGDTITDEEGEYSFTNLSPDETYIVEFVAPAGREFTRQNASDDTLDSDADPDDGLSDPIDLDTNETDDTIDAGLLPADDTDGDGIPDNDDIDDDNDGILDVNEGDGAVDTDRDGVPDSLDIDSDNDGNPDIVESQGGDPGNFLAPKGGDPDNDGLDSVFDSAPDDPSPVASQGTDPIDSDDDGIDDHLDIDSDNDGITDLAEASDKNGDGQPDRLPLGDDDDNDGLDDAFDTDNNPGAVRDPISNPGSSNVSAPDSDGDGLPNQTDIDSDEDGIPDNVESQPTDGYQAPSGNDADEDGLDDVYDAADDNPDVTESAGTTPENTDNADRVDFLDEDSDNDDIPDIQENGEASVPSGSDADEDGLDDAFDDVPGNDPNDDEDNPADDLPDSDGDVDEPTGDVDYRDVAGGDTDGDGIPDEQDIDDDNDGILDVNEGDGTVDTDGDGVPDSLDIDSDDDGNPDLIEAQGGDPGDAVQPSGNDADDDGLDDVFDEDDGDPSPAASQGTDPVDTDDDGIDDHQDIDSDNDGITDLTEANDKDGDGQPDLAPSNSDADGDGLDDAFDTVSGPDPTDNPGGSTTSAPDTDDDGRPNQVDIDSDEDGIPDNVEAQPTDGYQAPSGNDADDDGLDDVYDADDDNPDPVDSQGAGINGVPENTDGNDRVDYLDPDSDNDGTPDVQENGEADAPTGTDSDDDGLDDAFDDVPGPVSGHDPNDDENNPADDLPDGDGDVNGGGDVDYRDTDTPGDRDTDGDDIPDSEDIDDDNDGILDVNEGDGAVDTDGDGVPDSRDIDSDNDGNPDLVESQGGDPGDVTEPSGQDADDDGLDDVFDEDTSDPSPGASGGTDPIDSDEDGIDDHRDIDSDDDGITDLTEANDKNNDGQPDVTPSGDDTDGDGLDNAFDTNPDAQSPTNPADSSTSAPDEDDDGLPNQLDTDSDEDGIPDNVEAQPTDDYQAPSGQDSDEDGLDDAFDADDDNPDPTDSQGLTPVDTDEDGAVDPLDRDSDNDGTPDVQENGEADAPTGNDADGDGLDDAFDDVPGNDPNDDEDNPAEDLPDGDDDVTEPGGDVDFRDPDTPGDLDTDGDDIPDSEDIDDDNDGILDINEGDGSRDTDGDGVPDSRDIDSDNDGNPDLVESQGGDPGNVTEPSGQDADGDGLDDVFDDDDDDPNPATSGGTDPVDSDDDGVDDHQDIDSDNDGITDLTEANDKDGDGQADLTPTGDDSDGDGLDDVFDTNPLAQTPTNPASSNTSAPDTDDDGRPNQVDIDSDDDGVPDNVEAQPTDDYQAPSGEDSDGDGLDDVFDEDDDSPDPTDSQGLTPVDTDEDGTVDPLDEDSDDDGTPDVQENGEADAPSGTDTDEDGLDDAFDDVPGNDPNDDEDDPATDLPDSDDDVGEPGGDVDFRDPDSPGEGALVNIGNLVWHDEDNDALYEPDTEEGIDGIVVQLFEAGDDPTSDTPVAEDTTQGGLYGFDELQPGTYFVYIPEPPADFPISSDNTDGADNNEDNDDNGEQSAPGEPARSPDITLAVGDEPTDDGDGSDGDLTVDFGFYARLVSVGDTVFEDTDNDGVQESGEPGIAGVTVQLFEDGDDPTSATPVDSLVTDAAGEYFFDDLQPGDYFIYIPNPPADNPASSTATNDPNDGEDQDDNGDQPNGSGTPVQSDTFTLEPGTEPTGDGDNPDDNDTDSDRTIDFGFWNPAPAIDVEKATNGQDADQGPGPNLMVGEPVEWTYQVENIGNVTLVDIALTDDIEGVITCPATTLAPGDTMICTQSGTVVQGAYTNMATVQGTSEVASDDVVSAEDPSNYQGVAEPVVNLGNLVWHDENNDGEFDPDEEEGIDGVTVELYAGDATPGDDAPLASQETSGGGFYAFNGLQPGSYIVHIPTAPADFPASSTLTDTSDNGQDNDDNGTQGSDNLASAGQPVTSPVIELALGTEPTNDGDGDNGDLTVDFGFFNPPDPVLRLGNQVWEDRNNNGILDSGEPGIPGVLVQLFTEGDDPTSATPLQSTTTNDNGIYMFRELAEGNYFIYIPNPPADFPGSSSITDTEDNDEDNDDNGSQDAIGDPVQSPIVTLTLANEPANDVDGDGSNSNRTVDFGFWAPVTVGDRVFIDNNGDGIQDPGEPDLDTGVTVTLFDADEPTESLGQTTTDDDGNYLFENLPPGSYFVVFDLNTLPDGFQTTVTNAGDDDAADSDAFDEDSSAPGQTDPTEPIPSGGEDLTLDMGVVELVRLGDRVFLDENRNGIDDDEPGVADVTVILFQGDGTPTNQTTETDANGNYIFEGLAPGSYFVTFDLTTIPAGFVVTPPNAGTDDAVDSDANTSSGETPATALDSGDEDLTLDMGIQQPEGVRVGDRVFDDTNANGVQDPGEPGVSNITVLLLDDAGAPTGATTTTDESGNYMFDDLTPGAYAVRFDLNTLPDGFVVTTPNVGDDGADSDADPTSGETDPTPPIPAGGENLTLDMGIFQPASLGDLVFNDLNADGIQDGNEPGVSGVTVTLQDVNGTPVNGPDGTPLVETTDANGNYLFDNLPPGTYRVIFQPPTGFSFSPVNQGDDDAQDSDPDPGTGATEFVTLVSGVNDLTVDAGVFQFASLGDRVFQDANGNGIQDPGDVGVAGVALQLFTEDGTLVASTTSDATGNYSFNALPAGQYFVQATLPNGLVYTRVDQGSDDADNDVDPLVGRTDIITVEAGSSNDTVDIGLALPVTISNFIFNDADEDGIRDPDKEGVAGVVINVIDAEGNVVDTTTSNESGFFQFTNLPPGDFRLEFEKPPNLNFTIADQGTDDATDSDADPINGQTDLVTFNPGEITDDLTAGFVEDPTAIDLLYLKAEQESSDGSQQIVISWGTAQEIDTFGYHIYRSTAIPGQGWDRKSAVRITKQMVPAQGTSGGTYEFTDTSVLPGLVYVYWLTEVENGVEAVDYGPVGAWDNSLFTPLQEEFEELIRQIFLYLPLVEK